ncbi:unnamed protein product [Rangifer tarandus platyrhynchus]|uniref:Uncharacterized protein n=1 Tax=Rangifer tarandus platyrhynchus TaxID=3082113 RepID=A0ABN8ZEZ1_RANTA|nr:unnamed protein product [Rangifer tarandus platyrhynchus]
MRKWVDTRTPSSGHWAGPGLPGSVCGRRPGGNQSKGLLPDSAPEGRPVCCGPQGFGRSVRRTGSILTGPSLCAPAGGLGPK